MYVTPTIGQKYDVSQIRLVGWTLGDSTGSDGYELEPFFKQDGSYRGPDVNGIEPIIEIDEGTP